MRDALDHAALAGGVAAFEQNHDLALLGRHPVLQLHQLALQPEKLLEVDPAVERFALRMVGGVGQELVQAVVVDLHFQLFVEAVGDLLAHALLKLLSLRGCFGWHVDLLRAIPVFNPTMPHWFVKHL